MAITAAQQTAILKVVSGLFNAAPGATYLTVFANYMQAGGTQLGLANILAADAAFTTGIMGGQVTVASQVQKLMANFGLTYAMAPVAGTASGDAQNFFTGQINAGVGFGRIVDSAVTFLDAISAKQAAGTALTAAETIYATTAQTLQNKALVAEHYSSTLGTASGTVASLQAVLSGVTATTFPAGATAATVTVAQLNAALAAGGGTTGAPLTLTTGVDALVGTANNDTISALNAAVAGATTTWTPLDTIDGGAGSDTLNILDTLGGFVSTAAGVTVTNVEIANVRSVTGVTLDTSAWAGLTALNVTQSNGVNTVTAANTTAVTVTDTAGAVTVNGGSTVTITDGAGAVAVNSAAAGAITAVTVTGGTVTTIADANVTADTIATVSLTSVGGAAVIGTDALTTLNLSTSAFGATVTAAAATRALTLNMNGNTAGTVTDNTATTLNINNTGAATTGVTAVAGAATTVAINSTAALTLAALTAGVATAVSIAGAGATVITADTLAAAAVVTSTSTGGVTLTQQLLTGQQFAGAASTGNDVISVAAASTVANNVGAGNNTASLAGAMGVGGTLTAGAGVADTLIVNAAAFSLAGVTGFEILGLGAAATGAYDATGFTALSTNATVLATTFNSVAANAGLTLNGVNGLVTYNLANSAGTTDVLALSLVGAATGANSVTAAGIETVNITASNSTAVAIVQTLTLSAAAATTVTVTGGALTSVVLVNTDTTITSLNASAVAGGNFTWTTGALAAASTITGSATGINTVTIAVGSLSNTYVGGAGNDLITSNNVVANTVTLGNGANSYTHAGAGVQTVTGGTGVDTIITGTGNDVIVGGGGADQITGGMGADSITVSGTTSNIIQAIGHSGANTSTTIQTSELTSTFDVVRGLVAGDTITTGNTNIVTAVKLVTAGTNLAGSAVEDSAIFARGTYDAVNGTFSFGAAGLDSALTYDSTTGAGITNETIILVGFVSGASTAVGGVITLV